MIKEITQACITTLINGYERQINNEHIQLYRRMALKDVVGDLGDFLDYVADLKEDVQPTNIEAERSYYDQIETKDYQITMLKNENLKLTKTLEQSETDLLTMEETNRKNFRSYQSSFQEAEKCNAELKTTNVMWQNSCSILKSKLDAIQGPQWKE